jgi:predicted ATPase/class 3 adenylate cyclase
MSGHADASSGVLTFLFTDIEGSTRRWEADSDAMRAALEVHDQVLRGAVTGHRGVVFKHTGDGMCAAFTSPRAAVDAAIDSQRKLGLPVRMAIATGEAALREGDYFGPVLNRASRVMSAGHGGQILVDGLTADLVSGTELLPLGPRRLRDIAKPVQLFQVCAPGLRAEFPPLNTSDPTGNLRLPTTSFVGRDNELAEVEAVLGKHRLVTLTGVGGVGKTRLAIEVATRSANDFADGVWLIELAAVGDPAAVPDAVAAALGITQQPGMSVTESVASALEGRNRLLLLDNCEHVVDAAADVVDAILARSPTVRILATSREGMRAADEQIWPVPSLDVASAAAQLFEDRATAVAPGISLDQNAPVVAEICRRLDGIPLAIELAASRMSSMTVGEIRDRLDDRFRLLVGSRRGLERHQTLRHAVQWSYDLLDELETSLLARCSVFAGGFDLLGACAVSGTNRDPGGEFVVLDLLDALVRKSLLVVDRSTERTRFTMLETIRQFAEEQLVASGAANEARAAHARYFAGREDDLMAQWDGPGQRDAYKWFTVEQANLRAAFRWAADHDDLDTAAAIAVYATFLGFMVEQHEPIAWAVELIEPAKALGHRRLPQLYVMAALNHVAGRAEEAVEFAAAGQAAIESGLFDVVREEFQGLLGGPFLTAGQPERWAEWCRTVITRDGGSCFFSRTFLVLALAVSGALEEAKEVADDLLAGVGSVENPVSVCYAHLAYGVAHRDTEPGSAYEVLRPALAIAQDSGNRQLASYVAAGLSRLAAIHLDPLDAFELLELTLRHHYDTGSYSLLRSPLAVLAALFDRLGLYESAATISEFAATPFTRKAQPQIDTAIAHLREVLGDTAYESLAHAGASMTNAAMAAYAFDQIEQARAGVLR